VNSDGVRDESVENVTGVNSAVSLYLNPVRTGPSQSEIQSAGTPRRPAPAVVRPSRFRDDQFETQFRPGLKNKVRQMHFTLGKGESVAVEREQPNVKRETLARQVCQTLGKGESNGSKLGNSAIGEQLLSQPYLIRKNGFRLGYPTWPKIRFKSRVPNRWKFRVRKLN